MCYDEALDEAKNKAEQLPQFKRNGRVWVRVGDKEFPKDWFVRNAVLEEIRKYKRQSVMEKKQHSLWNRPASDVMNGSQQNSTKNKSRRKLWLKPGFLCLVCFFLASAAFFVLGKYYYDRNLQEMKEAEIQSYQSRKFTLAGYEIGEELDSVDGYHRCVSTNCFLRTNFKWEKAQCLHGYHKVAAIDSANLIDGMRGFFKLDVFASEYTEKGVTRNKISHICLTADGIPEKMKFWTSKYYALILEEKFGRRRFGRRIDQIERHGCWDEKIANWVACMNLENDRMLRIRSNEPGRVSVELIDCFVPSRPRNP